MRRTWVLVADGERGRIFQVDRPYGHWVLLAELTHPQSRPQGTMALVAGRGALAPAAARKEVALPEAMRFAAALTEFLERGMEVDAFARLVVVAPLDFLGMMRQGMSPRLAGRLVVSLPQNLTTLDERELSRRLGGGVWCEEEPLPR